MYRSPLLSDNPDANPVEWDPLSRHPESPHTGPDAEEASGAASSSPVDDDDDEETSAAMAASIPNALPANVPSISLYSPDDLHALHIASQMMKETEEKERAQRLITNLRRIGYRRELLKLPVDWERRLDGIERTMPNFAEAVDILRSALTLAQFGKKVVYFPPLLLVGDPGIGKTVFANKLAAAFNMPLTIIAMQSSQSNAQLGGSEQHWSNAKSGLVFSMMTTSRYANPLIFLDEVDKAGANASNGGDPTSPLLTLLEPATASAFRDLCFPQIGLNCSAINWLSAANNLDVISEPIRSRYRIVHVAAPSAEQALQIAESITMALANEILGPTTSMQFSVQALEQLSRHAPRRMRMLASEGIGRALRAGRHCVEAEDIRSDVASMRRMGFLA